MTPSPRHRPPLVIAVGLLGLAMIVISAVTLTNDHHIPAEFGSISATGSAPPTTVTQPRPDPTGARSATPAPVTSSASESPSHPARPTLAAAPHAPAPSPIRSHPADSAARGTGPNADTRVTPADVKVGIPVSLELPTLNVRAAVEPVATHEGVLAVPENPASVGWWTGSALPGSASGNTVIDGHIDSAVRGIGALWHLSTLTAGEHIIVTTATRQVEYQVVALRVYPKDAGIPATVFATAGPPQLVLISCGGPFDADRGSYQDNIAVFATPI